MNLRTKQQQPQTARQIARHKTWTLYGLSQVVNLREVFRFRWSLDDPLYDDDALELRIWLRQQPHMKNRDWHTYGEDFIIGRTQEGSWYAYAFKPTYSFQTGPDVDEVHIGDFPGFESAFFAVLASMAGHILDNIAEIRHERHMDSIHKKLEQDGLPNSL